MIHINHNHVVMVCIGIHYYLIWCEKGLPWWLRCKEATCNAGDAGSVSGSGRSPGEGNGNSLQYSCPQNPMDRGACWATVQRVAKSQTQLSDWAHTRYEMLQVYLQFWGFDLSPLKVCKDLRGTLYYSFPHIFLSVFWPGKYSVARGPKLYSPNI